MTLILSCCLLMAVLGIVYNIQSKKIYKVTFFIRHNPFLTETKGYSYSELKKVVDDYFTLIKKSQLHQQFKSIKDVTLSLTEKEDNALEIILLTHDTSIISSFKDSMLEYINQQPYILTMLQNSKKEMTENLSMTEKAMRETEAAKQNSAPEKALYNYSKDILEFERTRQWLKNRINFLTGYNTTVEPKIIYPTYKLTALLSIPLFVMMGLIAGLVIAFAMEKLKS